MNFVTHKTKDIDIAKSCLQGYVISSYKNLVEKLGEPMLFDDAGGKVDAEWHILFDTGDIATIYNYKDGYNYCGDEGENTEDITEWHVGGFEEKVVGYIHDVVGTSE